MALKATIHKAQIQLSDMDRNVYCDPSVTIERKIWLGRPIS